MALTDFEIQTACAIEGLFPKVLAWRDAAVAVVAAERDALADKLRDIELKLDDPDASKEDVKAEKEKTAKQRQRQALQAEKLELETKTAQVVAALELLKDGKKN